jgi:hypothetical protein
MTKHTPEFKSKLAELAIEAYALGYARGVRVSFLWGVVAGAALFICFELVIHA